MSLTARLLVSGFEPVNLSAGNVKPGDEVVNLNDMFGTLIKITKKGNYKVRYDVDYADEPVSKYTATEFERFFLVKERFQK
tara:strand:- start:6149 stop:6391 length:243 start_codon:yes stop_codon:yes gene_type:complete